MLKTNFNIILITEIKSNSQGFCVCVCVCVFVCLFFYSLLFYTEPRYSVRKVFQTENVKGRLQLSLIILQFLPLALGGRVLPKGRPWTPCTPQTGFTGTGIQQTLIQIPCLIIFPRGLKTHKNKIKPKKS